jgi:hypothetical protein
MGHTRLGEIPTTQKWSDIVARFAGSGDPESSGRDSVSIDVANIARQTLDAARGSLDKSINDLGLRYTFYLLTQIALSSREDDWRERWTKLGLNLQPDATLFDLTSEMQAVIDNYLMVRGRPTDISEMAQQSAGEALTALAGPKSRTLFGNGIDETRLSIREFSTKKGFSKLGQMFFGRFMARFLNFYLSRITAANTGGDQLHQVGDLSQFNYALKLHCEQSARIVRDFSGGWYSKTQFEQGINLENTSHFLAVAIRKIEAELERQKASQ